AAANSGDELHLNREQLMAIDTQVIETSTPWTEGVNRFEGPLFRRVLEAAGARGERVRVRTLNDYTVDISLSELQQYDVILALQHGGVPLGVRQLGPVFVLYPFADHPALFNQSVRHRSAWHVISVEVLCLALALMTACQLAKHVALFVALEAGGCCGTAVFCRSTGGGRPRRLASGGVAS